MRITSNHLRRRISALADNGYDIRLGGAYDLYNLTTKEGGRVLVGYGSAKQIDYALDGYVEGIQAGYEQLANLLSPIKIGHKVVVIAPKSFNENYRGLVSEVTRVTYNQVDECFEYRVKDVPFAVLTDAEVIRQEDLSTL